MDGSFYSGYFLDRGRRGPKNFLDLSFFRRLLIAGYKKIRLAGKDNKFIYKKINIIYRNSIFDKRKEVKAP